MENNSVLNGETIESIREVSAMSKRDILKEVIEIFITTTPEFLASIRQAFEGRDADVLAKEAHKLKGSAASIGACKVQSLAAQVQHLGEQQDLGEIAVLLEQLEEAYQEAKQELISLALKSVL